MAKPALAASRRTTQLTLLCWRMAKAILTAPSTSPPGVSSRMVGCFSRAPDISGRTGRAPRQSGQGGRTFRRLWPMPTPGARPPSAGRPVSSLGLSLLCFWVVLATDPVDQRLEDVRPRDGVGVLEDGRGLDDANQATGDLDKLARRGGTLPGGGPSLAPARRRATLGGGFGNPRIWLMTSSTRSGPREVESCGGSPGRRRGRRSPSS